MLLEKFLWLNLTFEIKNNQFFKEGFVVQVWFKIKKIETKLKIDTYNIYELCNRNKYHMYSYIFDL